MDLVNETVEVLGTLNGKAYLAEDAKNAPADAFVIPYLTGDKKGVIVIESPKQKLEVGALQAALDVLVKERGDADVDYIHGTDAVENLASRPGNAGFLLPAMDKFMLFPAVAADGALPRKTFSMNSDGSYTSVIDIKDHNYVFGDYHIHCYCKDSSGKMVFIDAAESSISLSDESMNPSSPRRKYGIAAPLPFSGPLSTGSSRFIAGIKRIPT